METVAWGVKTIPQTDSVQQLSRKWILKERLEERDEELIPVLPFSEVELVFHEDYTYTLKRSNSKPNAVHGEEVTEYGNWKLNPERGLIGVSVTSVEGRAIRSAMLYRWQIEEITEEQLVLCEFGLGRQFLVFEAHQE